ncbi:hypothetical protein ABBQ32_005822 [Trebouxia sp. C0010 RCD-2024]
MQDLPNVQNTGQGECTSMHAESMLFAWYCAVMRPSSNITVQNPWTSALRSALAKAINRHKQTHSQVQHPIDASVGISVAVPGAAHAGPNALLLTQRPCFLDPHAQCCLINP